MLNRGRKKKVRRNYEIKKKLISHEREASSSRRSVLIRLERAEFKLNAKGQDGANHYSLKIHFLRVSILEEFSSN